MKTAIVLALMASQIPLPELRIEPSGGGSVIHIRNVCSQPLTAFLLELVDYPGSSFSYLHDSYTEGIPAGVEKEFSVSNMTIGAAPDYVKVQAALYADGSSSGVAEKIDQLIGRRKTVLRITRELISRCENAQSNGTSKTRLIAGLREWAGATNERSARGVITDAIRDLEEHSVETTLTNLHGSEQLLLATKPSLQ